MPYYCFASLAYLLIITSGDREINVIPEIYQIPSRAKGSLFGAGLKLQGNSMFTTAPYYEVNGKPNGKIFECPLIGSSNTCTARSSVSGNKSRAC